MRQKLFFLFLIFFMVKANAQQTFKTPDGKSYRATNSWNFICERYAFDQTLKAQVAKTDKGGILKLSAKTSNEAFYIGGTVYLFLDNNNVITCTDKNLREHQDNNAIAYYTFSAAEMALLKASPIANIRFSIKGKESSFSSQTGYFTAENKKSYFEGYDKSVRNTFETETEIRSLYP